MEAEKSQIELAISLWSEWVERAIAFGTSKLIELRNTQDSVSFPNYRVFGNGLWTTDCMGVAIVTELDSEESRWGLYPPIPGSMWEQVMPVSEKGTVVCGSGHEKTVHAVDSLAKQPQVPTAIVLTKTGPFSGAVLLGLHRSIPIFRVGFPEFPDATDGDKGVLQQLANITGMQPRILRQLAMYLGQKHPNGAHNPFEFLREQDDTFWSSCRDYLRQMSPLIKRPWVEDVKQFLEDDPDRGVILRKLLKGYEIEVSEANGPIELANFFMKGLVRPTGLGGSLNRTPSDKTRWVIRSTTHHWIFGALLGIEY